MESQERVRSAFHEAGHAVALMEAGALVERMQLDSTGGFVTYYANDADPYEMGLAMLGGSAGEQLLGWRDRPQEQDARKAVRYFSESGYWNADIAWRHTNLIVLRCEDAVHALADKLLERGTIERHELAEMTRSGPLQRWRHLYE
jgi:hypothetical protein